MKRNHLVFALAVATVLAAGCKKDQGAEGYVTLNATIDNQTKMHIVDGGSDDPNSYLYWDLNDAIFINNASYSVTPSADIPTNASIANVAAASTYRAVYPASLVATGTDITNGSVAIELPATQTYSTINGHQRVDVPMVASTEGTTLQFHNICSVVRVMVNNATGAALTLDRIVVEAQNAVLSGAATATVNGTESDRVSMSPSASHTATLSFAGSTVTVPDGETRSFDIIVPPFNNDNVTITLYNTDDEFCGIVKSGVALAQNTIASVTMSVSSLTEKWVDLGLPSGLLWATCNVGASTPEGLGDYFAWGETTSKTDYSWDTYTWCYHEGYSIFFTKYCNNSQFGYNGFTDNLTTLQPADDAATANYGGRTPTEAEWQELDSHTTFQNMSMNEMNGRLFTSISNGKSIFLPAAGERTEGTFTNFGSDGYYSSSSLYTNRPEQARCFITSSSNRCYMSRFSRCHGVTVRAVRDNPNNK